MWTHESVEYYLTVAGETWLASASPTPLQMHALWDEYPWDATTLPCGSAFDVIALPPTFGGQVVHELHHNNPEPGPVTTHHGTVHVFCRPGTADRLRHLLTWPEWHHLPPLHCYGPGDTVPIPPLRRHQDHHAPDRWITGPATLHPPLPDATTLLRACLRAARTDHR